MNIVRRAIILAAGFGKRMRPITDDIPKPLVRVNGQRMIDTIINGLRKNGINDIYIVVGYKKEQFSSIEGVTLIENPFFASCNNISSLYVARDLLENAIILDGDQIINNYDVLSPYFERSGYNVVWSEKETKEWLLYVENDIITSCCKGGGRRGWALFSISRWNSEDGKRLREHIVTEFEINKNTNIFWDEIALFCYPTEYDLGINRMSSDDVIEIDDICELVNIDSSYIKYLEKEDEKEQDI